MSFKQGTGLAVFEPPTEEEIAEFDKSLLDSNDKASIYAAVAEENMQKFLLDNFLTTKKLSKSNAVIIKSISELSKKGFGKVDIILPVYGNLQIVEPCLVALLSRTSWPFNLIIIDDASDKKTNEWLQSIVELNPTITLLTNNKNRGFAASINRGIKYGDSPYICLLNSDVIVTESWLVKMLLALEADPRNKIVNPVTNNTAEIALSMQEGASYLDMARGVAAVSSHIYPEIMPTGFCMMFPRSLINTLGYFDEGYGSYGEETDFWMRTITHTEKGEYVRWRAVLADDAYVFHERGSSFASMGAAKQMSLRRSGNERFKTIWPSYSSWRNNFNLEESLASLRIPIPPEVLATDAPYRIAFVVHSTEFCGGMKYIADIVNFLLEKGVDAKVVLVKRDPNIKVTTLGELRSAPIVFETPGDAIKEFADKVFSKGFILAATNELLPIVSAIASNTVHLTCSLFAQSAEPLMATDLPQHKSYIENYKLTNHIITVSRWLKEYIESVSNKKNISFVHPGVDTRLFYPRDRSSGDDRPTLLLCLNNSAPYRGVDRGVEMAENLIRIAKRRGTELRVMAYGVVAIQDHPSIVCLGMLSQSRIAEILGTEVDVFCDPAMLHSYGMPALEASASGVPTVCWNNKGVNSVIEHGKNGLIFPEGASTEQVATAIYKLLMNEDGQRDKFTFDNVKRRNDSLQEFVYIMEKELGVWNPKRTINIVTPHLRKHGGPTTILNIANGLYDIGHEVNLYSIYPDLNPEIVNTAKIPIRLDWKNISPCDVLIVNSDNEQTPFLSGHPNAKKKVMLKLSHNPRFKVLEEQGLQQNWDAIMTSTEWLKDICNTPTSGWNYPPRSATRIGWVHYAHQQFNCPPQSKNRIKTSIKPVIGTLIHAHPLKGTEIAIKGLHIVKENYGDGIHIVGVGEVPKDKVDLPKWIQYMYNLNRPNMANLMAQTDIWVISSLSEGLGRLALEAMSASCAVVLTETNAEFATDGENCIVVPCNDSEAITKAVDLLITNDALRGEIQVNGYNTACKFGDRVPYINNINNVIQGLFT